MKSTVLRNEVKEFILSDVQMSAMRLGVNAQFQFVTEKDYRGNDYLVIMSSKFQTVPALFKELWIEGTVRAFEDEDKGCFQVCIKLEYYWKTFGGGSNGTDLGSIRYQVDKDIPERVSEDGIRHYVHKEHGIEI